MAPSPSCVNRRLRPTWSIPPPLTVLPFFCRVCVCVCVFVLDAQLRRFDVAGIHRSSITALAWSPNGMKLFSGDSRGQVVYSSLDLDQVRLFSARRQRSIRRKDVHNCIFSYSACILHCRPVTISVVICSVFFQGLF